MAYSEEKDLIQNVKELRALVDSMSSEFSQVQPSIDEILALKDDFEHLAGQTTFTIKMYEDTLAARDADYKSLLENCRSQFKQVTDDVESLVNLEVNFNQIKEQLVTCLELSEHIQNLVKGPFVLMKNEHEYVEIDERIPYKHYLKVIDSLEIGSGSGGGGGFPSETIIVSPTMGISYSAQ